MYRITCTSTHGGHIHYDVRSLKTAQMQAAKLLKAACNKKLQITLTFYKY